MTAKIRQTPPEQDMLSHNRDLLLGLSRAAQTVQQAGTADEIYRAIGTQIKSLGGEVTLLMVNDDGQSLTTVYMSYAPNLLRHLEKLTGVPAMGYRIAFSPDSVYARDIAASQAEYVHSAKEHFFDALPKTLHPVTGQLMNILKIEQGILAPLHIEGETLGLMMVSGLSLNEGDVPAMESFAGQIAAGLRNVRLIQKLQDELSARKQVEESFSRSRNLLLALSRAAQAIQQARTEEEIYQAVGEQIKSLGHEVVILTASDEKLYLNYTYSTFAKNMIEAGEKLTGLSIQNYRFLVSPESNYGRILRSGQGGFDHWTTEAIAEALPKALRSMARQLARLLKIEHSVIAPLCINEKLFGTLTVASSSVTEADIPAIESFAAQVAISLNNARLAKQMQDELSARRQAEEAIRQTERHFKSLIEKAPDGIVLVGSDGKVQYASPSARNMFKYKTDAAIFNNPLEFIHPDDLSVVLNAMNNLVINPAYIPTLEYRFKHKDDSWHWVESTYSNLLAEPSVQAVVINFRDITGRKQTEEALLESESKFHSVITESADGIVLSDESGCIIEFNNAFEQMTGQKHEMVLGQFLWNLQFNMAPKHLRTDGHHLMIKESIQKALQTGQSSFFHRIMEVPFEHLDGSLRFIQQRIFSIRTEKGWRLGSVSRDITEQKRMEEALRANEESFKSLYQMLRLMTDNLPDLVWAKDMESRYTFANKAMVEKLLIAQNTEEPVGKTDLFFAERQRTSHPDNPDWHTFGEICMDTDTVIHKKKRAERFEEFGNVKGRFLFLDVYKAPFLNEQGNMIGTVGIGRDVTHEKKLEEERKQIQEALAASEAELRALFASMQDTVLVIDQDGVYRKIAPTNPDKLYISPEKVIGKHLTDFFPAEQVEIFLGVMRQVMGTKQTLQIEYEIVVNGEAPWFEASISPMGDDCTLWVARDISERKQAEAALIQSEQAYRTLFENMPIGLYRTSADGRILTANPALVNMFGCPDRSSLLERNAKDLYADPTSNDRFKSEISKRGVISAFEAEFRRNDQATFWAEDYAHVIYDKAGRTSYYEGSLINITDRKRAEDELRRANKSLEDTHSELQQMFAHEQILARTDGMTGLYNRRYFFELAAREFSAAIRYQRPLTIILFDIDGFKQVNDTFGHAMGDTLLIQVAQATATQVRDVDILARYGGDEFIILLPQTDAQQAFLIAERIRESIAAIHMETDNSPFIVTLSLGVAETIHTPHDASVEDAIRRADKALYAAKQMGRNNTSIFTEA